MFEREDGLAIHDLITRAAEALGATVNILQRAASRVGALDVGFVGGKEFSGIVDGTKDGSIKALYMLGADEFNAAKDIGWKTFVVYQGHHGDHGAARADVVLPGVAYTEKDGIYVNTEGRPQQAKKSVSPPGDAREDWSILRALSERLGAKLHYDTPLQLRDRIATEWPHLVDFDVIKPAKAAKSGKKGKIAKAPFVNPIRNFYLTNPICRSSDTMRQCSESFNTQEYLEAAE